MCVKTMPGSLGEVTSVEFDGDGKYLLAACKDNSNRLWDLRMVSLAGQVKLTSSNGSCTDTSDTQIRRKTSSGVHSAGRTLTWSLVDRKMATCIFGTAKRIPRKRSRASPRQRQTRCRQRSARYRQSSAAIARSVCRCDRLCRPCHPSIEHHQPTIRREAASQFFRRRGVRVSMSDPPKFFADTETGRSLTHGGVMAKWSVRARMARLECGARQMTVWTLCERGSLRLRHRIAIGVA